jgi:erythronate-4-phosphate dehydrogenase
VGWLGDLSGNSDELSDMKIIADAQIPAIKEYFGGNAELILKNGRDLQAADLTDAEVLIVRSVTRVDQDLLQNSQIKFVGSVATGIDHLDTQWLSLAGITWFTAQGFNAIAVMEYVIAVIAVLQQASLLPQKKLRIGVIGVGRIGQLVVDKLQALGFDVVQCDPLRAQAEKDFHSMPLSELQGLDLITLHTPLTHHGAYPTYHMLGGEFLQRQQEGCVLLNTSRGQVIDFEALKKYGRHLHWCLDVWSHEPRIDIDVLRLATIATPHVAGYSAQSKLRGVKMLYAQACKQGIIEPAAIPANPDPKKILSFGGKSVTWRDVILKIFNPAELTDVMRKAISHDESGLAFDDLRKHFNGRYEFNAVAVSGAVLNEENEKILRLLGITI